MNEVKDVVSNYGVYVGGELCLICNSKRNADLIKAVLDKDDNCDRTGTDSYVFSESDCLDFYETYNRKIMLGAGFKEEHGRYVEVDGLFEGCLERDKNIKKRGRRVFRLDRTFEGLLSEDHEVLWYVDSNTLSRVE